MIVPVIEQQHVDVAEASTERPESASTSAGPVLSMPRSRSPTAPIVVGSAQPARQSGSCSEIGVCANADGRSVATTIMKIRLTLRHRMLSAISFGVLRRSAPSTSVTSGRGTSGRPPICISTTIRSEEHPGPARDRAAVTARLADHG